MRKIKMLAALFSLFVSPAQAELHSASLVTESFLDKIKGLEDRNGQDGDNGNSRGAYQMGKGAWHDTNFRLKQMGLNQYTWADMREEFCCRYYCRWHCRWLETELRKHYKKVSAAMIYASYNAGLSYFIHSGGLVSEMPAEVRARCAIF